MPLEKNELSRYASCNYIWSLSVLSNDEINSGSYLDSEPQFTIIRSGGFTKDNSILTDGEVLVGANVEYFIDDVEIGSLYSPNPRSGVSAATSITFKVMEPYSVGLFFQTLALAASATGHEGNYIRAPMLLRCGFVGFDDAGNKVDMIVRDLAISLIDANFTVNASGAIYNVTAIPWNHQAYGDEIQQIKTEDKLSGYTVEQVLASGEMSLVTYLNKAEQEQVTLQAKKYPNEYLIEFPDSFGNYTATNIGTIDPTLAAAAQKIQQKKVAADDAAASAFENNSPLGVGQKISVSSSGSVSSLPRPGINTIGASVINTDLNFMGNQEYGLDGLSYDSTTNTYTNDFLTIGPDRLFSFKQGTPIQNIIQQVILTSTFTRDVIARLEAGGDKPLTWFRIETQVFNLANEGQKQFIYKIIPYEVDRSLFEKQGFQRSYQRLLAGIKKGYNYIYTGTNTDITNFDITINAAFFQMFLSDSASNANNNVPASVATNAGDLLSVVSSTIDAAVNTVTSAANTVTGKNVTQSTTNNPTGSFSETIPGGQTIPGGSAMGDARRRVAEHFHNVILNSDVELVGINLEVWGDPYFMPDTNIGNHATARGMAYQQTEVDVILNFNTPIDFDTSNTLLTFSSLDQFVGLYKIVQIQHSFVGGMFKQTLSMIRRPGQDRDTLDAIRAMLVSSEFNIPMDGIANYFSSGTGNPTELIYSTLFNSLGISPLLSQVAAFQNIANILPLPKDLLSAFSTLTTFSANISGIAASAQQLFSGNFQNKIQNATSLVRNVQSTLQNTVSSISKITKLF